MGYIQAVTRRLQQGDQELFHEWCAVVRDVKLPYEGDPEAFRDKVVGIQAEWDSVYNQVSTKGESVAIIMTAQVATPFTHDRWNIEEIAEAKRSTVLARVETSREMLDTGIPIIIAAPAEAWAAIKGKTQENVWNELNDEYDNLHGIEIALPQGVNGAVNIAGREAVSINFKQAQPDSGEVSEIFLMAGSVDDNRVEGRIIQFDTALRAANDSKVNLVLDKLAI